jgi:hypothetical protein
MLHCILNCFRPGHSLLFCVANHRSANVTTAIPAIAQFLTVISVSH